MALHVDASGGAFQEVQWALERATQKALHLRLYVQGAGALMGGEEDDDDETMGGKHIKQHIILKIPVKACNYPYLDIANAR